MPRTFTPAGVYRIVCGPYFYIGSSDNFPSRRYHHLWLLKKGQHYNKALQKAFDEEMDFSFQQLVPMRTDDPKLLRKAEQEELNKHRGSPWLCNLKEADPWDPTDEEIRALVGEVRKSCRRSPEARAKDAAAKTGAKNPRARAVIVTDPNGEETEYPTVTAAAAFFKCSQQSLDQWMSGKIAFPGTGTNVRIGTEWIWNYKVRFKAP